MQLVRFSMTMTPSRPKKTSQHAGALSRGGYYSSWRLKTGCSRRARRAGSTLRVRAGWIKRDAIETGCSTRAEDHVFVFLNWALLAVGWTHLQLRVREDVVPPSDMDPRNLAVGETVILLNPPLHITIDAPAKGRGGCSRMAELSPPAGLSSRRRDRHSVAPPSPFIRCFNTDKKGASSR